MKNSCAILLLTIFFVSCNDKNDKKETNQHVVKTEIRKHEILEYPLIFEDLGLKIVEFSSEEIQPDNFVITVIMETNDVSKFKSNHNFFIHAYDFNSTGDSDFINFDTKIDTVEDNRIIFKRALTTEIYDYSEFRFGLDDRLNKNRYFTRTIKNVSIKD